MPKQKPLYSRAKQRLNDRRIEKGLPIVRRVPRNSSFYRNIQAMMLVIQEEDHKQQLKELRAKNRNRNAVVEYELFGTPTLRKEAKNLANITILDGIHTFFKSTDVQKWRKAHSIIAKIKQQNPNYLRVNKLRVVESDNNDANGVISKKKKYLVHYQYTFYIFENGSSEFFGEDIDLLKDAVKQIVKRETHIIKARNEAQVRRLMEPVFEKLALELPNSRDYAIVKIENISNLSVRDILQARMYKSSDIIEYSTLGVDNNLPDAKYPTLKCVLRYFAQREEECKLKKLKRITRKDLERIILTYRNNPSFDFVNNKKIDISLIVQVLPDDDGICPYEINAVCQYFEISHFCMDSSANIILCYVPKNRTHTTSICYMTNGEHMYPLTNQSIRNMISHSDGNVAEVLNSKLMDTPFEGKLIICEKLPNQEVWMNWLTVSPFTKHIFLTKTSSLNEVFEQESEMKRKVYDQTCYRFSGKDMTMFRINPKCTIWVCPLIEQIMDICERMEVELTPKRLSIGSLSKELWFSVTKTKLPMSTMNRLVLHKYLNVNSRGGIVENLCGLDEIVGLELNAFDIKRAHTHAMLNIKLPILDVWDNFHTYTGTPLSKDADYEIRCDNIFPLRGNGIYCGEEVIEFKNDGIPFTIVSEIKFRQFIDPDNVAKFVKKTEDLGGEAKICCNALNGTMGTWFSETTKVKQTKGIAEASHFFFSCKDENKMACNLDCKDNLDPYFYIRSSKSGLIVNNCIPAFNRIIHYTRLSVWRMWKRLGGFYDKRNPMGISEHYPVMNRLGGRLVKIATDCITVAGPIPDMSAFVGESYGMYRKIDVNTQRIRKSQKKGLGMSHKVGYKSWMIRTGQEVNVEPWTIMDVMEEDNHKESWVRDVSETILKCGSCLLTAEYAGGGKTHIALDFQKMMKEKNLNVGQYCTRNNIVSCAFTNAVSYNLGGRTLHKTFHIGEGDDINDCMSGWYQKGDWIMVDEVSMVPSAFYNVFERLKDKGVNFLILGDLPHQLPPVKDRHIEKEFSYHLRRLCNFRRIDLKVNWRSDRKMIEIFDNIWKDNIPFENLDIKKCDGKIQLKKTYITLSNQFRKKVNDISMNLASENVSKVFEHKINFASIPIKRRKYYQDLRLVQNSPVVCIVKSNQSFNQQDGSLIDWNDKEVTLILEDPITREYDHTNQVIMSRKDFVHHFTVAYAMTCHRAIGKTLHGDIVIFEWNNDPNIHHGYFKKWFYTAISRTTSWDKLYLVNDSKLPY